ncbi:hypothetical protein D3C75_1175170 [compost metagenome]
MLGAANAWHDHMQIVDLGGVDLGEHTGEKIGLFLVIAFQHYPIARNQQFFQHAGQIGGGDHFALRLPLHTRDTAFFFLPPGIPNARGALMKRHTSTSWVYLVVFSTVRVRV